MSKKNKKHRDYTLDDIIAMAQQLKARVRFEFIPLEAFAKIPAEAPSATVKVTKRPAK